METRRVGTQTTRHRLHETQSPFINAQVREYVLACSVSTYSPRTHGSTYPPRTRARTRGPFLNSQVREHGLVICTSVRDDVTGPEFLLPSPPNLTVAVSQNVGCILRRTRPSRSMWAGSFEDREGRKCEAVKWDGVAFRFVSPLCGWSLINSAVCSLLSKI